MILRLILRTCANSTYAKTWCLYIAGRKQNDHFAALIEQIPDELTMA